MWPLLVMASLSLAWASPSFAQLPMRVCNETDADVRVVMLRTFGARGTSHGWLASRDQVAVGSCAAFRLPAGEEDQVGYISVQTKSGDRWFLPDYRAVREKFSSTHLSALAYFACLPESLGSVQVDLKVTQGEPGRSEPAACRAGYEPVGFNLFFDTSGEVTEFVFTARTEGIGYTIHSTRSR